MTKAKQNSRLAAVIGLFTAVTAVLQFISYYVKVGPFSITLTLIPIVLVSVLYGPKYSAILGATFGIVTYIGAVIGVDMGGNILFNASPFYLIILCLSKAVLCALASGTAANLLKKKSETAAVIVSAVTAPVVNTAVFIIRMFSFYGKVLYEWAGNTEIVTYIITGLVGINFLFELTVNVILSPVILRIIKATKRYFAQ